MSVDISNYVVKINGTTLDPQPKFDGGLIWSSQDVMADGTGRAEDGNMILLYVGRKRKLQFKFPFMSAAKAKAILDLINPLTFSVTYYDPEDGAVATRTFYKGDRQVDWYSYTTTSPYKELSFNVIEV